MEEQVAVILKLLKNTQAFKIQTVLHLHGGLTLTGCQVSIKEPLSLPLLRGDGQGSVMQCMMQCLGGTG